MNRDRIYDSPLGLVRLSPSGQVSMPAGIELPDDMPPVRNVATGGCLTAFVPERGTYVCMYLHGEVNLDMWECGSTVAQVACGLKDLLVLYDTGEVMQVDTSAWEAFAIALPGKAVAVRAGEGVWAAILADGSLYTWGAQRACRQLGRDGDEQVPGRVAGTYADVHFSELHFAAALTTDGQLYVWGGRGSTAPVLATQGTFARLAVARCHVIAVRSDLTSAYAWGDFGKPNFSARSCALTTEHSPVTSLVGCCYSTELYVECTVGAPVCRGPRRLLDVDVGAERARLRMPYILAEALSRRHAARAPIGRKQRTSTERKRPLRCEGRLPPELWKEIIKFVH
jgi:hypothetical protein